MSGHQKTPRTWVEVVRDAYPLGHDAPSLFVPGEVGDTLYDFVVLEAQDAVRSAPVTDREAGAAVLYAMLRAMTDLVTVVEALRRELVRYDFDDQPPTKGCAAPPFQS